MDEEKAKAEGLEPLAKVRGYAFVGYEPKRFGLSPVKAIPAALARAGMELSDVDLVELNEAFAAQYLGCERQLNLDREKANVHGGAIAMGHPVAATGSKILTTLLYGLDGQVYAVAQGGISLGGWNLRSPAP